MQFYIYLKMEPYLAEWYIHENDGVHPIHLKRGSAESDIVSLFLTKRPKDVSPDLGKDANLSIIVPSFSYRNPEYYNYLSPRAKTALVKTIYNRFVVQLWQDLHKIENLSCILTDLIYVWMETHGITPTPENCETLRQCYYRKRKLYHDSVSRKEKRRKAKESKEEE